MRGPWAKDEQVYPLAVGGGENAGALTCGETGRARFGRGLTEARAIGPTSSCSAGYPPEPEWPKSHPPADVDAAHLPAAMPALESRRRALNSRRAKRFEPLPSGVAAISYFFDAFPCGRYERSTPCLSFHAVIGAESNGQGRRRTTLMAGPGPSTSLSCAVPRVDPPSPSQPGRFRREGMSRPSSKSPLSRFLSFVPP